MENTHEAVEYLRSILGGICIHPCEIVTREDKLGLFIEVKPKKIDAPHVIGRKGIVGESIRTLMHIWGQIHDTKLNINILGREFDFRKPE